MSEEWVFMKFVCVVYFLFYFFYLFSLIRIGLVVPTVLEGQFRLTVETCSQTKENTSWSYVLKSWNTLYNMSLFWGRVHESLKELTFCIRRLAVIRNEQLCVLLVQVPLLCITLNLSKMLRTWRDRVNEFWNFQYTIVKLDVNSNKMRYQKTSS
jgi:hypothetical protein